ncbi:MAG: hypothetical protein KJ066_08280 [Acidobacteria bacterium]|nr:hypothetical protein [Acidobacteriota bacterium]
MPSLLDDVAARLQAGVPLSHDDAATLWATRDLVHLGVLAEQARRARHDARITFVRVSDVPIEAAASVDLDPGTAEVRLVGAPPDAETAVAVARQVVGQAGGTPVTAYSLADLERLCATPDALADLAARLVEAGVAGIAEAPLDRLREPVTSVDAVVRAACRPSRFVTARLDTARPWSAIATAHDVHRATGAVHAFAPLPREVSPTQPTTGYEDVKLVALARLVLSGVPSIQVDWTLYGPKLAQVALLFGADDLDAVSPRDDLSAGRRRAPLEEVVRNIRAAGLEPVERDGRFAVRVR